MYFMLGCETDLGSRIGSTTGLIIGPKGRSGWIYGVYLIAAMPTVDGDAQLFGGLYGGLSFSHLERPACGSSSRVADLTVL
jgi:hypothetical protein